MEMIKVSLTVLSFTGMWKPRGWRGIKALVYYVYQYFVLCSNYFTIISLILMIELKDIDLDELFDNVSLLLGVINVRQKMSCLIFERHAIKSINDKLNKSPFKPRSRVEEIISTRFNGIVRSIFICYMVNIGAIGLYCGSRFSEVTSLDTLPFRGWFPYNYSTPTVYWLTAAFQILTINTANIVDLMMDLLLSSIICHMCAQVHILKHRFNLLLEELNEVASATCGSTCSESSIKERVMIAEWVKYHIDLINLIKYVNNVFSNVIMLQYTVSSIILCALSFLMSHTDVMTVTFVGYFGYLITFNTQIFQQCYCAHTLTNESAEITTEIYSANWPGLGKTARKSVMIIMNKCHKPILITSSFFIILSLDSYTKIVKLAYTIFNVLT